jgi:hypothetical protein
MADYEKTEFSLPAVDPTGPAPRPAFGPGSRVMVASSDGNQYPATVRQAGFFVVFESGQEQWVAAEYVSPAT